MAHLKTLFLLFSIATCQRTNPTTIEPILNNGSTTDPAIHFDDPHRPSLGYPTSLGFLFIFATLLVGVIVRAIMLWTELLCVPYRVIMFTIGGIMGFCAHKYPDFKPIVEICYIDVDILLITFLPTLIFSTSYSVDAHSFRKSFPQILLVGVLGATLTALITAFMAYYLIESTWNVPTALLFGIVCSPIYPVEVVKQLKEMSKGKHISVLLLGEGLIGDVTVMIEFTAAFGYLAMALSSASQISLLLLRYAGGGLLLGIVMGEIVGTLLSLTYYDLLCAVIVTFAGAYLTYYIGEKFFYVSGLLGTVIAGVIVSNKKSTVAGDVEHVVMHFWTILAHVANSLVFTMVGVVIFEKVSYVLSVRQVSLVFVTYTTIYCSRLLVYAALTPLLRSIGYGMSWQHCMACVWGGLRGPLSLCLALIIFIIQTAGLVILSLLLNATSMRKVLKILGLAEISLAKKANMTNCVKRVMMTRDRCISMLKMDKFLADANWDLVQEANQRVLKAMKISYWRQYEHGKISKDGVRLLVQAVEAAADSDGAKINLDQLGTLWRPKRVLKAMKISYWRQYEHGKISKDGVRLLVQAVEAAADSDVAKINLDQLGTLWRPKRVLKAMKISYWRQYEHGKISKDGVRLLVQAVEAAADSDGAKINLDQLGTLWRPKRVLKAMKISYWRQYEHGKISKAESRLLTPLAGAAAMLSSPPSDDARRRMRFGCVASWSPCWLRTSPESRPLTPLAGAAAMLSSPPSDDARRRMRFGCVTILAPDVTGVQTPHSACRRRCHALITTAHAVWLRRKLVTMLAPDVAGVQTPHSACRRRCHVLITTVWFDGFIYLMILFNTPVILCELACLFFPRAWPQESMRTAKEALKSIDYTTQ
ncbi:Sperm-specific sodium proton exchanger [Operophtera brumata]|uniref:Sperm-specific sodium proton exchanger n=1 Tax=Operophtera brumata TaxID=104452 RepID=A0A0L7KQ60_OPEBR|nr:Sperm-specific sodium proton exchanger [Operophtera brumata]